jgi:23S rRNA (uracil1939-C5)-methyltransferase
VTYSSKKSKIADIETDIQIAIKTLNENGEGVGYYKYYQLGVEKTLPGEEVIVRYLPQQPRKNRIHLQKIIKKSPLRIEPPCPYFDHCGGCQLQHVSYPTQLEFKKNWIEQLVNNHPELRYVQVKAVSPMPGEIHYRCKTQLPFQQKDQAVIYGLYQQGTHEITPIDHCLVESRDANRVLEIVREWAENFQIPIYNEQNHSGSLRHVLIRKGQFSHQVMVILIGCTEELAHIKELLQLLKAGIPSLKSVILNYNPERTNRILGENNKVIWGEGFIEEKLGRLSFRIYPNTFFQSNPVQMLRLLDLLIKKAELQPTDKVLEIYCGTGTIGLLLYNHFHQLIGFDNNPDSIKTAQENAARNDISRAEFYVQDLSNSLPTPLSENFQPNIIIADPPRKGLPLRLMEDMTNLQPEKIIYISCNPKTLIPNLAEFHRLGYCPREIHPFDMFPYTAKVECLAILKRNNSVKG